MESITTGSTVTVTDGSYRGEQGTITDRLMAADGRLFYGVDFGDGCAEALVPAVWVAKAAPLSAIHENGRLVAFTI